MATMTVFRRMFSATAESVTQALRKSPSTVVFYARGEPTITGTTVGAADFFGGKRVALFSVPGAFTPVCHSKHVPAYISHQSELKKAGADVICCVAVNDPFTVEAWKKSLDGAEGIVFLADPSAVFTKAVGLDVDLTAAGLGIRSKRYSMFVDNGTVKALNVENSPAEFEKSAPEILAAQIQSALQKK
ncbi:mitochondrial peroxiredoxin (PRX) family protein PRX-like subfamily [Andalucia godoyi]|uniref:Mitochondrial peroxiredoxin (PRX) family protein PRX-like subfamily n=1 Tax=Andalucia godoyi TaxID=505711 RepID=A0A8K0AGX4_ANDGO|nr:mitochondrial peroxiredoxin (PRX) family protein PRX-like subfamily [Andalucia godoyi]|eukprot:ANDGO_01832.mRNA.1 mitochondrial peroxiredoxin (PRX) family protein PRX-like subfamily